MSDGSIPRPASASLRPVLSVLARTLTGGAEGGRSSALLASLLAARPAAPAPTSAAPPAATGTPPLPTSVPAWARALATVQPDGRTLGEAVADLARVLSERGGERAIPGPVGREVAETLRLLADVEGLDGEELRVRLGAVGLGLEGHLARGGGDATGGGERPPLDPAELLGLKAQLLRARGEVPEGEVRQRIERVLATLDGEQLYNVARAEHGEAPVEHLPIPDGDQWSTAWFQRGGGGEGDDGAGGPGGPASLTVGLTLSALGPVRLDLALAPDLLRVRIAVARPDVRAALEEGLDGLLLELERVGRPVAIGVELARAEDLGPPPPVVDGQVDVAA